MLIGYARVSTGDQDTRMQLDALGRAGCMKVFDETGTGASVTKRVELHRMLDALRAGDVVVVYKIDRLARSLRDLLRLLAAVEDRGAGLRSLSEQVDTTTPAGRMMLHMLGAIAEFERALIRERSMAGQRASRERGVHQGRPALLNAAQARRAADDYRAGRATLTGLARLHGCHMSSIKRAIRRAEEAAA